MGVGVGVGVGVETGVGVGVLPGALVSTGYPAVIQASKPPSMALALV